jgi:hypothetical protein
MVRPQRSGALRSFASEFASAGVGRRALRGQHGDLDPSFRWDFRAQPGAIDRNGFRYFCGFGPFTRRLA